MGDGPPDGADIQLEHGHVRIVNAVMEALPLAPFNAGQLKVMIAVIRETWGWQRKDSEVSASALAAATSLARSTAAAALRDLVDAGALIQVRDPTFSSAGWYRVQKDPRRWGQFAVTPPALSGTPDSPGDRTVQDQPPDSPADRTPVSGTPDTPAPEPVVPQGETPPLKTVGKKEKDSRQIDDAGDTGALITRVVDTANRGLQQNETVDQARLKPITKGGASRQAVLDWLEAGIDVDTILGTVHVVAAERFRASPDNPRIYSLSYFGPAVREAAELAAAEDVEVPAGATLSKADRKLIRRRQDLEGVDLTNSRSVFSGD